MTVDEKWKSVRHKRSYWILAWHVENSFPDVYVLVWSMYAVRVQVKSCVCMGEPISNHRKRILVKICPQKPWEKRGHCFCDVLWWRQESKGRYLNSERQHIKPKLPLHSQIPLEISENMFFVLQMNSPFIINISGGGGWRWRRPTQYMHLYICIYYYKQFVVQSCVS